MSELRVTFDPQADAAYIALREITAGDARFQCVVECSDARGWIVLDLDSEGRLIGIEVLGASDGLPVQLVADAKRPL
jgi:uncharacterized protein YuzE